MTMTIPSLTTLTVGGVVQAADLNAMANACTFLLTKPIARVHAATTGQSLSTSGTAVNWDTVDFDTDSMWAGGGNPSRMVVATPGFYKARYMVNNNGISGNAWVQTTTGANNPAGSGITQVFLFSYLIGGSGSGMPGAAGVIPSYMYIADYFQVFFKGNVTASINNASCPAFFALEYVSI